MVCQLELDASTTQELLGFCVSRLRPEIFERFYRLKCADQCQLAVVQQQRNYLIVI